MIDKQMKELIHVLLNEPTATVELFSSVQEEGTKKEDQEFKPTKGKTVVIRIDGGANNCEINRVKIPGE